MYGKHVSNPFINTVSNIPYIFSYFLRLVENIIKRIVCKKEGGESTAIQRPFKSSPSKLHTITSLLCMQL